MARIYDTLTTQVPRASSLTCFNLNVKALRVILPICRMTSCLACKGFVDDNLLLKCTGCGGTYHYVCLNLTMEHVLNIKNAWLCSFCTSVNTRRRRNDDTPVQRTQMVASALDDSVMSYCDGALDDSRVAEGASYTVQPSDNSLMVTPPNSQYITKETDKSMSSCPEALLQNILSKVSALQEQFLAIHAIQSDLSQVKCDIAEMKNSIDTKLDELAGRMHTIESRVSALETCRTELDDVKKVIGDVINDSRRNEQWVRRSNIQINGVPETKGENLFGIVQSLAELSGFQVNVNTDIDFVTRIAVRNDSDSAKPKPIIVKLQARYKKDDFISSLRKFKIIKASDLGFANSSNRIYINDHLSSYNKYLLKVAKERANQKNYQYCWVRNCTVMVRRDERSPVLFITSEEALNKIT